MSGDPNGIRTRVTAVKGQCPRPLDDRVFPSEGRAISGLEGRGASSKMTAPKSCLFPHTPQGADRAVSGGYRDGGPEMLASRAGKAPKSACHHGWYSTQESRTMWPMRCAAKSTRIATPMSFSQQGMSSCARISKTSGAVKRAMRSLSWECRMKSAASALHFSL